MFDGHPRAFSMLMALLITGTCLTFFVLCAYAYTSWNPVSRPCMNRVSLRLLALALIFNLGFGVSFLFGTLFSKETMPCAFITFFTDMEKFYYLGTVIFAAACSVTPLAAGVYGWSSHAQTCWFNTRTEAETFRWAIGTESFWLPFMATGEAFMFLTIIAFFISYEMATRRRRHFNSNTSDLQDRHRPDSPFVKYRYTIIRIGLYPLVSCLINFCTAILGIYQLTRPINWQRTVAALTVYSSRPIIYSLLAFADPSFIRAAKKIWQHMRPPTIFSTSRTSVPTLTQISDEFTSNATWSSAQISTHPAVEHENQDKVQDRSNDIALQL
ncbi:hypothetical protein B0H16DRAFT_1607494 [Mycena metata]|uniref:G-protein coupled receptors family 2 profile 2 domain-containing protein n=1 Tax=Mycena metata TaxID=1033252 RepID=A0AAD7HF67_9AGAR|nr:hypothetical protein B0H16DRAFT_1607494 [Mycena metata]